MTLGGSTLGSVTYGGRVPSGSSAKVITKAIQYIIFVGTQAIQLICGYAIIHARQTIIIVKDFIYILKLQEIFDTTNIKKAIEYQIRGFLHRTISKPLIYCVTNSTVIIGHIKKSIFYHTKRIKRSIVTLWSRYHVQ